MVKNFNHNKRRTSVTSEEIIERGKEEMIIKGKR